MIHPSRRQLLLASTAALAASALPRFTLAQPATRAPGDGWRGLKVGVASYSFRKFNVEQTIAGLQRVGLSWVSIKDFHLPMKSTAEERKAVAAKFKAANITPISVGVISWKKNDEAMIRAAFEYARDVGVGVIVCNPAPDSLATAEKLVKEFDIRLAIHNHGPEDKVWPEPNAIMNAIGNLDPRIGLCIDVGHTARAGTDPAEAIVKYKDRLFDLHIKDVAKIAVKNEEVECGRGVLDVKGMLAALVKINYAHHVGFEHEKDPADPVPGLAESVGYVRGVLAAI